MGTLARPLERPHALRARLGDRVHREARPGFDNLAVLGIGGIPQHRPPGHPQPPTHNLLPAATRRGPRLFVVDNVDPANLAAVLDVCDPRTTLFNVVSKSGETAETAAQFMIVRDLLAKAVSSRRPHRRGDRPEKGTMRKICDAEGYVTARARGRRRTVLRPLARQTLQRPRCAASTSALLDGAPPWTNAAAAASWATTPPPCSRSCSSSSAPARASPAASSCPTPCLYLLADWFRQLWAESLGKRPTSPATPSTFGFTPIKALGTTDQQHSQVQLYREGPNDKVIGFVERSAASRTT
ncbi:MAG: hypothetical protein R3B49_05275 [Phycisphaerales bacterium]